MTAYSELTKSQLLAALAISIGSMVIGFSFAYTSPALQSMRLTSSFSVSEYAASWVGGIIGLGAFIGSIIGGPLITYLGRKKTIIITAIPFIVNWLLIASAKSITTVLAARGIAGFCIGITSLAFPVYLTETIHPKIRGTLSLLPTVFGNAALVFCFTLGSFINWRKLALIAAIIPIPFMILMFFIPETPFWLTSKHRDDEALDSLRWLRKSSANVTLELQKVKRTFSIQRRTSRNILRRLTFRENLEPLLVSIALMFFQQFSGISAVIFYAIQIFKNSKSSIDDNLSAVIIGVVNLLATLLSTALVDRVGRKVLLHTSNGIMVLTLACYGTYLYFENANYDVTSVGWLPLACLMLYVLGFSLGSGPIPWLIMGEILPSKVRSSAACIVTASNWLFAFIVIKVFFQLTETIGSHGTFWTFGVVCLTAIFFTAKYVPETRARTLEEIELHMMKNVIINHNLQHSSSVQL